LRSGYNRYGDAVGDFGNYVFGGASAEACLGAYVDAVREDGGGEGLNVAGYDVGAAAHGVVVLRYAAAGRL